MRPHTTIRWAWLLSLAATAQANTWTEQGDAPPLPPGQQTQGAGSLTQIVGTLPIPSDVDLFAINIDNPGGFSASTVGGAGFNTQLFLFNSTGRGVTHHDDVSGQIQQSQLTGQFVPGPGLYYLAISGFNRDPFSAGNQPIWNDQPFNVERPADGPGAPNPVANWGGMGPGGPYTINLTGARFLIPPPPPPQITQHPVWQPVPFGGDATFGVTATGAGPLTYQWFHAGEILTGATGPTVVVSDAQEPDYGPYYVRVTDTFGQTVRSHSADLTVHVECVPPIANPGSCYVPEVWRIDPVPWNRDTAPQNKIDDLIDADPGVRHDIIVDFRECVTPSHLDFLEDVGPLSNVTIPFTVITSVAMSNVSFAEMTTIAGHVDVALVEKNVPVVTQLANSLETTRLTGPVHDPDTVESAYNVNGAGFNIAIVDSGVDDSVHETFTNDPFVFVAGYNAEVDLEENPDDADGHGTHVASIALGRGGGSVWHGVAPGAGLIDIRVMSSSGIILMTDVMRGLAKLLERQRDWNVHIINISLAGPDPSNGLESLTQLTDRCAAQGMIVVTAAGNSFPSPVNMPPARAPRAITVAASDDMGTPDRSDDTIHPLSQAGPAIDNVNLDGYDELKPEVTAPGRFITAAVHNSATGSSTRSGTSMASPHVAGIAALCLQVKPSLNPESLKTLLINTAERRGGASAAGVGRLPAGWNDRWGWGLVDAFAALEKLTTGPADLRFNVDAQSQYNNVNVGVLNFPPQCGVPNQLFADIRNAGPGSAENFRVTFGVYNFSASGPPFVYVGTTVVETLLANESVVVTIPWMPNCLLSAHQCLEVSIGCDNESAPMNNTAQRNMDITNSPVYFEVQNFISHDVVTITFVTEFAEPADGWTVQITPPSVTLGPDDLPQTIEVLPVPPLGTPDGVTKLLNIESHASDGTCLGGVTIICRMKDCNTNGIDDWFDIRDGTSEDDDGSGIPDECELPCPGDLNGDRLVELGDLAVLLSHFGTASGATLADGDLDGDGDVELADLAVLLARFGSTCP